MKYRKILDNLLTIFLVTLLIAFFIRISWDHQSNIMYEPPAAILKTKMEMISIKRRVIVYVQQYNKIPRSLEMLPVVQGPLNNIITDGWGRKIQFSSKNNTITLKSYGEDNRKGGWGVNRDIIKKIKYKKENGRWVLKQ